MLALSPEVFNRHESSEDVDEQPLYLPTVAPPTRTTTLRTIIKPDSEQYHSNSGIHVTFNTEDKNQGGHQFQEHIEESAIQPVITDIRNPSIEQPIHFPQQPRSHQQQKFHFSDQRARAFEVQFNNHNSHPQSLGPPPPHFHRFSPPQSISNHPPPLSSQQNGPFQAGADQGLLLSYNRYYQQLQQQSKKYTHSAPPAVVQRFQEPILSFSPPANSPPLKFRQSVQPKPIPIPIHHGDKSVSHKSQNHYTNYQQLTNKQQSSQHIHLSKPQLPPSFQNPFAQSIRNQPPLRPQQYNSNEIHRPGPLTHLQPAPPSFAQLNQQQTISNNIIYQQRPLGPTSSPIIFPQAGQPTILPAIAQEFNRAVPNAELIESLPKFEQHITETVPLSEINKPFSPFRQLASLSFGSNQAQQSIQTQSIQTQQQQQQVPQQVSQQQSIQSQQLQSQATQQQTEQQAQRQSQQQSQQLTQEELLLQQSIEHSKLLHQQQREQQQLQQHHQQQQQQRQSEQTVYQPQEGSILVPNSPQIILPMNYQNNNYLITPTNKLESQISIKLTDKIIPGRGVSNLASDVLPEFQRPYEIESRNKVVQSVQTTERPTTPTIIYSPSTTRQVTKFLYSQSTPTTSAPTTTKSSKKVSELPDEVPDDLREQLLSSGILDNADISILDYDKVGDVPLEDLPPEHLANFYGAGGASQISSSNQVLNIVKPNGDNIGELQYTDSYKTEERKHKVVPKKQNVDLKVVRFDSTNQKSVTDKYIKQDSTVLPSVDIDQLYNRYLPLKVNGDQFPIPDSDVLRNKKISSVVVLAPVDSLGSSEEDDVVEDGRYERDIIDSKEVHFLAGDSLKNLLRKPTKENFKRWLEKESKTHIDLQSVVLLVVK